MYSDNQFNRPHNPVGYVVFGIENKNYLGKFYKLESLRQHLKDRNVPPEDAIVFRAFYPDQSDYDRRVMEIGEYAYPHTEFRILGGVFTEIKSWQWDAQEFNFDEEVETFSNSDIRNSFILFLHKVSEFFRILS